MAPASRPACRFFAAFYRWSCSTQRAYYCHGHMRHGPSKCTRFRCYSVAGHGHKDYATKPTTPPEPQSMMAAVRNLMRHVPSSVAVITVPTTHPETKETLLVGTAISSLNTVTLDPPHISFNIKTPSRTLDAIQKAEGQFRVNFLENSNRGAHLANSFTQGNSLDTLMKRSFSYPLGSSSPSSIPKFWAPPVVASMDCQLVQEASVADHIVAIAEVTEFEARKQLEPTLLYHEGSYKTYGAPFRWFNQSRPAYEVYCSYPLFPGEQDKAEFIRFLKERIKQSPDLATMGSRKTAEVLRKQWGAKEGVFGLSLVRLANQCRVELGLRSDLKDSVKDLPITSRYYGRLSPMDLAMVVNRARTLVQDTPDVLTKHWGVLTSCLDVHFANCDLLPSDILEPLRKDGLVAPFELRPIDIDPLSYNPSSIESVEQVEYRLRALYKTMSYEDAATMRRNDLVKALGIVNSYMGWQVQRMNHRIVTEAYPEVFSTAKHIISGHVTPAETRVVVNRIVSHLNASNPQGWYSNIGLPKFELMRRVRVHPLISGMDIDFLLEKLMHLSRITNLTDLVDAVDCILEPLLSKGKYDVQEVQSRVKRLVETHTLQVTGWHLADIKAAIGFNGTVETEEGALLDDVLGNMLANELQSRLDAGRVTPDEEDAIVACLRRLKRTMR